MRTEARALNSCPAPFIVKTSEWKYIINDNEFFGACAQGSDLFSQTFIICSKIPGAQSTRQTLEETPVGLRRPLENKALGLAI